MVCYGAWLVRVARSVWSPPPLLLSFSLSLAFSSVQKDVDSELITSTYPIGAGIAAIADTTVAIQLILVKMIRVCVSCVFLWPLLSFSLSLSLLLYLSVSLVFLLYH